MAPEHKQMFKGMTFCKFICVYGSTYQRNPVSYHYSEFIGFVPRELASGPRKRRIAKVIEYGAILSDDCKDGT